VQTFILPPPFFPFFFFFLRLCGGEAGRGFNEISGSKTTQVSSQVVRSFSLFFSFFFALAVLAFIQGIIET